MMEGMNAQLELFEQDKQEGISQVAYAMQKVYNLTHKPKIFSEMKEDELSSQRSASSLEKEYYGYG